MPISEARDAVMHFADAKRDGRPEVLFTQDEVNVAREEGRRQAVAQTSSQISAAREEGRKQGVAEADARQLQREEEKRVQQTANVANNHGWNDIIDKMKKPSAVIR